MGVKTFISKINTVVGTMRQILTFALICICNIAAHTDSLINLEAINWSMTRDEQQWLLTIQGYDCEGTVCRKPEGVAIIFRSDEIVFNCHIFATCSLSIEEVAEHLGRLFDTYIYTEAGEEYTVNVNQTYQYMEGGGTNCYGVVGYNLQGGAIRSSNAPCPIRSAIGNQSVEESRYTTEINYEGEFGDLIFVSAETDEEHNLLIKLKKHRCCGDQPGLQ